MSQSAGILKMSPRSIGSPIGVDEFVSRVNDETSRSAIMAVRSEVYRLMEVSGERIEEAIQQIGKLAGILERHIATTADQMANAEKRDETRRADEKEWRESARRLLDQANNVVVQHMADDKLFQEGVTAGIASIKVDGQKIQARWLWWLVGILISLLGGSWLALGAFVWAGLRHVGP